jgi:Family of unknown function (DUF6498)
MIAEDKPGLGIAPGTPAPASKFFLYLPIVIVLISNLIPLIGVIYWGWDTFVLLMLYWLETVVIAFWTLFRILIAADVAKSFVGEVLGRLYIFIFFLIHSGGFMAGHLVFLWAIYGSDWAAKLQVNQHNFFETAPREFWDKMVLANGLLIPLIISFVGRGIAFFAEMARQPLWTRLVGEDQRTTNGSLVGALYVRIVIMHLVILGGAALAQKYGALAPLVLLIVAKTIVDLVLFVRVDLKAARG